MAHNKRELSIVNLATLCCTLLVTVYVAVEFPLIAPPRRHYCQVYHRIKIVAFAFGLAFSYFALWYRVYTLFYRNTAMRKTISKFVQILTFLPFILLILMVICNLIVFLSASAYQNTNCGCMAVQEKEKNFNKWILLVLSAVAFQATLLFSFIYPLYLHRKKMLSRGIDHTSIIPIVKRAAVIAAICITSDLITSGFGIVYNGDAVYLNHVVISLNLLVNLMGVIMSFATWRRKLFPWRKQRRNLKQKAEQTESRASLTQTNTKISTVH